MKKQKEKQNKTRQGFLLTFFTEDAHQEKEVNGYWLIKQYDANRDSWQVAIYEKEAYQKRKEFLDNKNKYPLLFGGQDEHIKDILNGT